MYAFALAAFSRVLLLAAGFCDEAPAAAAPPANAGDGDALDGEPCIPPVAPACYYIFCMLDIYSCQSFIIYQ